MSKNVYLTISKTIAGKQSIQNEETWEVWARQKSSGVFQPWRTLAAPGHFFGSCIYIYI